MKTLNEILKPEEIDDRKENITPGSRHWGYHLLMDCSGCNKGVDNKKTVEEFLDSIVRALKMKKIGKPMIVKVDSEEEGRGVSGVQLITTSTITFHGDNESWAAYIDVFSCKPYKPEVAIKIIKQYFQPKHIGTKWITRDAGDYPKKERK